MNTTRSMASFFSSAPPTVEHTEALGTLKRRVGWPLAAAGALLAAWCAWAPLSGAVVASGQVQTELGRKTVQHQEGGIVRELLVRQGQTVRRGDPLLIVGDVRSDAAVDLLRKQMEAERLRAARARAELAMAAGVEWPEDADPQTRAHEAQLFDARRNTLAEQVGAMQTQMREAHARIAALTAQLDAADQSAKLARDELAINAQLLESGFIQKTRLLTLQRGVADMLARSQGTRGQIAEARMQISSLANDIARARGMYRQRAADDLREAGIRMRELQERLRPTQDQSDRQTVRAPVDGVAMALRVSAPGTAVGPREPLLDIVPSNESLVVELRVDPHDIDHVHKGDEAEVRLSAFDTRTTRLLKATVSMVAPDAVIDGNTRQPWFLAQVEVRPEELSKHPDLHLQAGMPAEVFVTTPPRSLLEYLLKPLGVFAHRAMREP